MAPNKISDLPTVAEPFELFYKREFRSMVALAYATSGSRLASEDIAQDALIAAGKDWDRVGALNNPAAWVRRAVINRSVSTIRTRVVAARAMVRLKAGITPVSVTPVPAESEHLWNAVRRLPRRQRQAVALRYVNELQLAEIAEILECSRETVSTHLRRAHQRLATELQSEQRS